MKYPSTTATIDPSFLSKVDRVFDASPVTVFNEMLQNSRRAGATSVHVRFTKTGDDVVRIAFMDNGKGIEDPSILLRLAARGWDAEISASEDPAGMGFFCLSNFQSVEVTSRDWSAYLRPATFRGESPMQPIDRDPVAGTIIAWYWTDVDQDKLVDGLTSAARYCDISSVTLFKDGVDEAINIEVVPFLHEAEFVREFPEHGYTIGAVQSRHRWPHYKMQACLNFHGVRVNAIVPEGFFEHVHELGYDVLVDITSTNDLQLVLPARNALKHNAARELMFDHCKHVMLGHIAMNHHGNHKMPFTLYKEVMELGYDVGEAKIELPDYTEGRWNTDDKEKFLTTSVIAPPNCRETITKVMWQYGHDHTGDIGKLYLVRDEPSYEGYKWYDGLPTLESVQFVIDGKPHTTEEFDAMEVPTPNKLFVWADSISVVFQLNNGLALSTTPPLVASGQDCGSCFESAFGYGERHVFVVRDIKETDGWLDTAVGLLRDIGFSESDDCEADSDETQQENFDQEATAELLEFAASEEDSIKYLIESHLRSIPWTARRVAWTIVHDGNHRNEPVITIVDLKPQHED